ncbi:hypothetical protein LEMLEM_LOCUS15860 [Lemmus lemmus]
MYHSPGTLLGTEDAIGSSRGKEKINVRHGAEICIKRWVSDKLSG